MSAEFDDPITFEVVKNALSAVSDEMAITVLRTAHSQVIRDSMDFSTGLCDANGRLVGQGLCVPLHLGAIPDAMTAVLDRYGGSIEVGDVYVVNAPDEGGMHLPDIFMFKPTFHDGQLVGFAVCIAHFPEIGGRVPGGNAVDSTEIYQEGLQIPIMKLFDRGNLNETLLRLLLKNVRYPDLVLGDLRAEQAACHIGEVGLIRLAERYGVAGLTSLTGEILDYTERILRAELKKIPDGRYEYEDYIDDDGFGSGPIRIAVTVTIDGDELIADFTGTAQQVQSALNSTMSFTRSAVYTALKCVISPDIPSNAGFYRPITVIAPPGTIVNACHPAARAARGLTGFRTADAVWGALAKALPGRVSAAGEGGTTMISIGGVDQDQRSFAFIDFITGGWGARPTGDGVDGTSCIAANMANVPVEEIELYYPLKVESYGFEADTGGAGKWRGCLSVARQYRFLGDYGVLQIRSDRRRFPPYGLAGGHAGSPSWNVLNPGAGQELLPSHVMSRPIHRGDVIRHVTAGGGGYGDPTQRQASIIATDLLDQKMSGEAVRNDYGVPAYDQATATVAH